VTPDQHPHASRGLDPLQHLPIAAYVDEVDDDGRVRTSYGSQKYEELTGVAVSDVWGDAALWDDRVHPDDFKAYARSFDELWQKRRDQDIVYRFRRGDDTWVWIQDRASAVYDVERRVTVISGVIADITGEREAQREAARTRAALEAAVAERTEELALSLEELRASRAGLARAQQLAAVGSFEWAAGGTASASDELFRIYGLDPARGMDKETAFAAVHPEDRARFAAAVTRAASAGGEATAEYRLTHPGGDVRVVEAHVHVEHGQDGTPSKVVGSVQDITDRRAAEEATQRSRDLLHMLADVSARFLSMPLSDIDEAILGTLARVGDFARADRCYVVLLDETDGTVTNSHEWCASGIAPMSHLLQRAPLEAFSWSVATLLADKPVVVERVDRLPEEAEPERALMAAQDVKSFLMVPLRTTERPLGLVGFDAVRSQVTWPQETVLLLRTVANTLAAALERKRVGSALEESEANHRAVFEAVDDVILVTEESGRILHGNPSAAAKLGYSLEELRGMYVLDLQPPALRDEAAEVFAAMLAGQRTTCPLPLQRRDGGLIPADTRVSRGAWNGRPCFFGVSKDLTAEREALDRFDRVFHANPALMAVNDMDDLRFVDVNDAFVETLGYTRAEVVGRPLAELDILPGQDQRESALRLMEAGSLRDREFKVRTRDGRLLDGVFSGEAIRGRQRDYFVTVMLDITDRKRAEEELRALNTTLEEHVAERTRELSAANRELEAFVQSIAHDLRAPLRTIGSFGQILLLEHGSELDAEGSDALQRMLRANARLGRLIDGLLELSGLARHGLRRQELDLTGMARDVVAELQGSSPGRLVDVAVADGLHAEADAPLTAVVLENLLGNAWKFSATRRHAHIEVFAEERDGETVFVIRDDGAGFDPRYAHRLFQAFERLHDDAEFTGTGIGLATVRRIVERHGGRVWAESTPGEGATFFFTLPDPRS
jgi:PAS domain S-box-containing protein